MKFLGSFVFALRKLRYMSIKFNVYNLALLFVEDK